MPVHYNKAQRATTALIEAAVAIGAGLGVTIAGIVLLALGIRVMENWLAYGPVLVALRWGRVVVGLLFVWLGGFVTARIGRSWLLCGLLGIIEGGFVFIMMLHFDVNGVALLVPLVYVACALLGYLPLWRKRRRIEKEKQAGENMLLQPGTEP